MGEATNQLSCSREAVPMCLPHCCGDAPVRNYGNILAKAMVSGVRVSFVNMETIK